MITLPPKKVAVEPIFDPDMIGSLYVPDQAKERCDQGIIKYRGSDCEYLEIGDHVLFSGYSGTLVKLEGEGLLILIPEEFVTCIVLQDPIIVDGLFFRSKEGDYFPATHEQATMLMARALEKEPRVRPSKNPRHVKIDARPRPDEYAKLR